ncbi:DUF5677 domain-containing protein [Variovorax sp. RT4R15]|uniref:DUF5677 domain-containing protein n=1 Tax=Variovorax sp. RT4R15 TaxID=3443737 RepID=UPI003F478FBD
MEHDALNREGTDLAGRACALLAQVLQVQEVRSDDKLRVAMLAHAMRMLRYGQAVVTLANAGLWEPMCAVGRTVLEMGWVMTAVQTDPRKLQEWVAQAKGEAIKSIRRLKMLGEHERPATMSNAEIDAAIATMPPGKNFNLREWAESAGVPASYPTLYQQLSECAHAEFQASMAYTHWDVVADAPAGFRDADLAELPADCLNVTTALLLDAIRFVAADSMSADQLREVRRLESQRLVNTRQVDEARIANCT